MGNSNKKSQRQNKLDEQDKVIYRPSDIYIPPLTNYKYFERRVEYTTEQLEYSKEEEKLLSEIKPEKINLMQFPPNNSEEKIKVIIDTDIGTDWDDAMAIIYALHIPNLEILGITTNYGIPDLRAAITQKIIDAYMKKNPGKNKIPVISGASRPLGTHRELLIYGHEGKPFYDQSHLRKAINMKTITNRKQENASKFIASMVKKYPNQVKIISIGIPTNIGLALKNNKEIIPLIKEIIIMGCGSVIKKVIMTEDKIIDYDPIEKIKNGEVINLYPNHNVSGDTIASKILFDSGIPTKIISHSVSSEFWAKGSVIDYLKEKANSIKDINNPDDPEGVVGLLMKEWFSIRRQNGQCPHDPLTVHEAVYGEDKSPIIYARGRIILTEWAAFSTFIPLENGPHYLGVDIKKDNNFLEILSNTIMSEEEKK